MGCNQTKNCNCGGNSCCGKKVSTVNHGDTIINKSTGAVYESLFGFNIPGCGDPGVLVIEGSLTTPPANSQVYLSSGPLGAYLTITRTVNYNGNFPSCGCQTTVIPDGEAYKYAGKEVTEITVVNDCTDCNQLAPGTFIAGPFGFLIAPPECVIGTDGGNTVLCTQLVVPAVGAPAVNIVVSPDTSPFSIGNEIQLAGRTFTVTNVLNDTVLSIRNDGLGGNPGDIVDGSDCLSVRIFIVGIENPCEAETALPEADALLVCDDGIQKKLKQANDTIAVKRNDKIVTEFFPPVTDVGSETTTCINLNPALDPQEYSVGVVDGSVFAEGQIVYFSCDEELRKFRVKTIAGNNLILIPGFTVTEAEPLANDCDGCFLLPAECCDQCTGGLLDNTFYFSGKRNLEGTVLTRYYSWDEFPTAGDGQLPLNIVHTNDTYCNQVLQISMASNIWGALIVGDVDMESDEELPLLRWMQQEVLTKQGIAGNIFAEEQLLYNQRNFMCNRNDPGDMADWTRKSQIEGDIEVPNAPAYLNLPLLALPRNNSFLNVNANLCDFGYVEVAPGESVRLRVRTNFAFSNYGGFPASAWAALNWGAIGSDATTNLAWYHQSKVCISIFSQ